MASPISRAETPATPPAAGGDVWEAFATALDTAALTDIAAPLLAAVPRDALSPAVRARVDAGRRHLDSQALWRIAQALAADRASRPFVALVDQLVDGGVLKLAQDRLVTGGAAAALPVLAGLAERRSATAAAFLLIRALTEVGRQDQAVAFINRQAADGHLGISDIITPERLPGLLHLGPPAPEPETLTVEVVGENGSWTETRAPTERANRSFCCVLEDVVVQPFDWVRLSTGAFLLEGLSYRDGARMVGRQFLADASGRRLIHPPLDAETLPRVPGTTLLVGKTVEYGHFLLEGLERAVAYRRAGAPAADTVLLQASPPPAFEGMLKAVGLMRDGQATRLASDGRARFERLILPAATTRIPTVDPDSLCGLRDIGMAQAAVDSPVSARRLYLARKPGARRNFRNLEADEAILARHGFERVYLEDYPIDAQIAIVRQADAVIGIHGSALFNMIWARPGTQVGLAVPGHWPSWPPAHVEALLGVFAAAGLRASVLLGREIAELAGHNTLIQFHAPVDLPEAVLARWIAGLDGNAR